MTQKLESPTPDDKRSTLRRFGVEVHAPQVNVALGRAAGTLLVSVEASDSDDARGGRLTLTPEALELLPAAIARAVAAHRAERAA